MSRWNPPSSVASDPPGADIACHDDDGVAEVHFSSGGIGHVPVFEHLEQHVEDIGVGLLDLVEQHDRIGSAPHLLGELAAFVVADVPGGAPARRETLNFSMYSDMSMVMRASSLPKRNSANVLASRVLPTPVGPRNRNEPTGRWGS